MGPKPRQRIRRQTLHQCDERIVSRVQIGEQVQQVGQRMDVFPDQRRLLLRGIRLNQPCQQALIIPTVHAFAVEQLRLGDIFIGGQQKRPFRLSQLQCGTDGFLQLGQTLGGIAQRPARQRQLLPQPVQRIFQRRTDHRSVFEISGQLFHLVGR